MIKREVDSKVIKITYPRAKRDYQCYGCVDEIPIPKGEWYMRCAVKYQGKMMTVHYCQRCCCAIENKAHCANGCYVKTQGDLRWSKLSNSFKKLWQEFLQSLRATNSDEEKSVIESLFMKRLKGEE